MADYSALKKGLLGEWGCRGFSPSSPVRAAFMKVPREKFVLKEDAGRAYHDIPLLIMHGQTISQPFAVVRMTDELGLRKRHKVLEVGTGSGYQAAMIAEVVGLKGKVVSTERIPELVSFARANLKKAGIISVEVVEWDGSCGYEKEAPYDRIIVTAACPGIPRPLVEQLKPGGILIAPVSRSHYSQKLVRLAKHVDSSFETRELGDYVFVPLIGKHGFSCV